MSLFNFVDLNWPHSQDKMLMLSLFGCTGIKPIFGPKTFIFYSFHLTQSSLRQYKIS